MLAKSKRSVIFIFVLALTAVLSANTLTGHTGFMKLIKPETNGHGHFSINLSTMAGSGALCSDSIVTSASKDDYFQSTSHASFTVSLGNWVDLGAKTSFVYDSRDSATANYQLKEINNIELGVRIAFKRTGAVRAGMYLYGDIPAMKERPKHFYDFSNDSLRYDHRLFSDEFLYNPNASFGAKLLTSFGNDNFRLIFNTGYLFRTATEEFTDSTGTKEDLYILPDAITLGGGMEVRTSERTRIFVEYDAEKFMEKDDIKAEVDEFPQRIGGGLQYLGNDHFNATLGGFMGLNDDAPKWQAYAGITFFGTMIDPDTDKDGYVDEVDKCPNDPEDFDGFEDQDGCPEPDNDKDGILDIADKCPNDPEDKDGYEDDDGCPEPDNDGDGINDDVDKCPNEPEDFDGYEDVDGCPEFDNDGDGIKDKDDACPDKPEDFDGFEDTDGCPEFDNDKDGITDDIDKCPDVAETVNGFEDDDGCPDAVILKKDDRIVLDNIYFKLGSAELESESFPTLNDVKRIFIDNPGIVIQIEGHTDSQGSNAYNLKLSQARAESVGNYLINNLGIPRDQLRMVGFGEEKPVASNKTSKGRAQNRRIEFNVISTR